MNSPFKPWWPTVNADGKAVPPQRNPPGFRESVPRVNHAAEINKDRPATGKPAEPTE
jgi:hypothetical protein